MYYDLNKPKISDEKFDTLKSELLILEEILVTSILRVSISLKNLSNPDFFF